jgi:hypothetical protein
VTRAQLITALLLVTVICAGLAALLAPEAAESTPKPARLVAFPPSEVVRVEVRLADGSTQRLSRQTPDSWWIELPAHNQPDDAPPIRWPASSERVRAFLRILDRAQGVPAEDAAEPAAHTTVTLTSEGGQAATITLPTSTLGGRAVVFVGSGDGTARSPLLTTDELPRLLAGGGMLHWLDQRAFAGVEGQVVEIGITSAAGTMTVARAGGGWRIEAPFAAPAESALVAELLAGLQTLPIADPSTNPAAPGTDPTVVTLTTNTRRTAADGSVVAQSARHTMSTIGSVGQSGRAAVRVEQSREDGPATTLGPLGATVDAARLAEIVRQPAFYIARRASTAQPADIRGLKLTLPTGEVVQVDRTDAGWARDGANLPAAEGGAVEALVELLTLHSAAVAAWGETAPADAQHLAGIEAQGLGGLTIASADLAVGPLPGGAEDTRAYALLRLDQIARYYTPESAVEAVRWVAGLAP